MRRRAASFPAMILAAVLLLAAAGCGGLDSPQLTADTTAGSSLRGAAVEPPSDKPEFVLRDTSGRSFDFSKETAGQLTILYFGYTHCPDICPVNMSQLAAVLSRPGMPAAEVVFVTVDPARDTPHVLRSWLDHFNKHFIGLTGTRAQLDAAQKAAGVPVAIKQSGSSPDDYAMGHAAQVLVYAPDGKGYSVYPFGTRQDDYLHDLPILAERGASSPTPTTSTPVR